MRDCLRDTGVLGAGEVGSDMRPCTAAAAAAAAGAALAEGTGVDSEEFPEEALFQRFLGGGEGINLLSGGLEAELSAAAFKGTFSLDATAVILEADAPPPPTSSPSPIDAAPAAEEFGEFLVLGDDPPLSRLDLRVALEDGIL